MATRISRPVTRETPAKDPCFGKPIVVQLDGAVVRVRQKGCKTWFTVAVVDLWRFAYQTAARR